MAHSRLTLPDPWNLGEAAEYPSRASAGTLPMNRQAVGQASRLSHRASRPRWKVRGRDALMAGETPAPLLRPSGSGVQSASSPFRGVLSPSEGERDGVKGPTSTPQSASNRACGSGVLGLVAVLLLTAATASTTTLKLRYVVSPQFPICVLAGEPPLDASVFLIAPVLPSRNFAHQ